MHGCWEVSVAMATVRRESKEARRKEGKARSAGFLLEKKYKEASHTKKRNNAHEDEIIKKARLLFMKYIVFFFVAVCACACVCVCAR